MTSHVNLLQTSGIYLNFPIYHLLIDTTSDYISRGLGLIIGH